jgi:hypothetical protein
MEVSEEVLGRIERRLEAVERKLDLLAGAPQAFAYKLDDAAKMLSMGRTKLDGLIAERKVATVTLGGRRYVPVAELIRLTTPSNPRSPPSGPRPRTQAANQSDPGRAIRDLTRRR